LSRPGRSRRRVERFAKPAKLRREDGTYVSFLDAELWPDFVDLEQEPLCDALAVDPDVCVELVRKEVAKSRRRRDAASSECSTRCTSA
jgi:hypothetical protein